MPRYIDADELPNIYTATHQELVLALEEMPTADVAEVKRGRWVETRIWGGRNYKCSVCDFDFTVDLCMGRPMWHYCPNCGAKMDEVEE